MLEITHEMIEAGKTPRGAWTKVQLTLLGIEWPPTKGWKSALVGHWISEENYQAFLDEVDS